MSALNKKRILSTVLAGAMALSMAVPALAEETVITGTYEAVEIDVVVPSEGTALINPYGLPVEVDKSGTAKATITGEQIVTRPLYIKNKMAIDLDVSATLSGKATGKGMTLATEPLAADDTSKSAFVYLQMTPSAKSGAEDSGSTHTLADGLVDEFAAWSQAYDEDVDLVLGGDQDGAKKMATLKAATHTSGAFSAYTAGSIALVRLAGKVVKSPDQAWTESDGFEATVAYTFEPAVAASVTLNKSTATIASGGTETLTATYDAGTSGLTVKSYKWESDDTSKATVVAGDTATSTSTTVTNAAAGSANVTVTVTLSDDSTVTATCAVTCS